LAIFTGEWMLLFNDANYRKKGGLMPPLLLCGILLSLSFSVFSDTDEVLTASPADPLTELQELKSLLTVQMKEWNEMKPALQRLIQSEKDLALIIGALDASSSLSNHPSSEQLLDPKPLIIPKQDTLKVTSGAPKKENTIKIIDHSRVKPTTLNETGQQGGAKIGIHLASYKEINRVERGWKFFKNRFTPLLADKVPLYYQVKVDQQVYTRLVVGPFVDSSAAYEICKELAAQRQYCQVISYEVVSKIVIVK